jgi:hypothetical protein
VGLPAIGTGYETIVGTRRDEVAGRLGYTDGVIVKHGLREGNLGFIGKPYTPQALAAKVRSVLDG